jgi:hypothetical protein
MMAQGETIGFRGKDVGHVADGARCDERGHHGGAERAGPAGDDDVAITVIHRPLSRCDCGIIADRSRGARSHLELS